MVNSLSSTRSRDPKVGDPLGGIIPPLVTPLDCKARLDEAALTRLIERMIEAGVDGLFLLGTTGEFCSLNYYLRKAVIKEACRVVAGRVPIVVNVSDTSLDESVRLAQCAAYAGAAAVAICPPYYFRVTQSDLLRYTEKFAQRIDAAAFLYNIPQNTTVEFAVETVHRLAQVPNVVGLKNSSGDMAYVAAVSRVKAWRPSFSLLVGNEELTMTAMDLGADGSICGGANMFPRLYVKLYGALKRGERSEAVRLQQLIAQIAQAIYTIGPASTSYLRGVKGALAELGFCNASLAEPMQPFDEQEKQELRTRLETLLPSIRAEVNEG